MEALLTDNDLIEIVIRNLMAGDTHLSFSSLSAFKLSPKDFVDYKLKKKKATDAMQYGAMVHCLVLEPEDFENRYLALDDTEICEKIGGAKPRATNQYKLWFAEQTQLKGDREIVTPSEYQHAKIVANNVRFNRASAKVLKECPIHESPIDWEYGNFKFKGFIDGKGEKSIFDLKTCPNAQKDAFQRTIINEWYYLQAAMYIYGEGSGIQNYYIIAVDKMGGTSVHKLENHLLQYGMEEYDKLIVKFNECILSDAWDQSYDFWSERFDGSFICEKPKYLY